MKKNVSLLMILSLTVLPLTIQADFVQWGVRDGGWCTLVDLPIPFPSPQNEVTSSETEGFVFLFNGVDLTGWIIQGMEKAGPKVIEGGVLAVGGWDYWGVITKAGFKNFILRFDTKFDPRGNSGILIHTTKKEVFKSAFEIQLAADYGKEPSKKTTGAIYGKVAPSKNATQPIGEWNSVEIKYAEPKLWVTINGITVQDGIDITQIQGLKHKLKSGSITIQRNDYRKAVYFKNIRIKRLPD